MPILPKARDHRLITIRRGGSLSDEHHHLLMRWAIACTEHVLHHFESAVPDDGRPRQALGVAEAWLRGEASMKEAHNTAFIANAAAQELTGAPKFAALSAGQTVAVAHVAAHYLGAAAYAIRAAFAAEPDNPDAGPAECRWQRAQLPEAVRALVLEDQGARNAICWNVFVD